MAEDQDKKPVRELARKKTVVRLLKENAGATIHDYETPSGRKCYRMVTAVDAPVPKDPLINISKHSVNKMLESGRLIHKDNYIILNPEFKNKKNGKDKIKDPEQGQSDNGSTEVKKESKARPETGRLF